ncbi:MAG: amino acid adenylation domain-containing protein [Pseudomonadota bacterium]
MASKHTSLAAEQKRALLAEKLRRAAKGPSEGPRSAPLSLAQQRLWFIDQMQPGQSAYTIAAALSLDGTIDAGRLTQALTKVRERHESLRTRFVDDAGTPVQVVDPSSPLELAQANLSGSPELVSDYLADFAKKHFDLATGPLLRSTLVSLGPRSHILAFAVHHTVADYQSLQILIEDCVAFYERRGELLPHLGKQYADYAIHQRGRLAEFENQLGYWRESLSGLPERIDLPTDRPRPPRQVFSGARHRFEMDEAISERIRSLASETGTTSFALTLGAFYVLLARYAGADDICIGTTVSERDRAEWQRQVGYFVNTLALRERVDLTEPFKALLARLRETVKEALKHSAVPFEQVVDATVSSRSLAHSPLFQVMFNLHQKQRDRIELPNLVAKPYPLEGQLSRFDLSLDLFQGNRLTGVLEYSTALFDKETAARLVSDYQRILEAAVTAPDAPLSETSLATTADSLAWSRINATVRDIPRGGLAALISKTALRDPQAIALIHEEARLTHGELEDAAGRLAGIISEFVDPGARVAICLPRGPEMVIALLAVLRLGATYIPLDPDHPPKRLQLILEDAEPSLLIASRTGGLNASCQIVDPFEERSEIDASAPVSPCRAAPEDLAYIIFTSGTTGRPKGVQIRQDSLVNLLSSMAVCPGFGSDDRLLAVTTLAFDIAALEIFLPLLVGGTLVLAGRHDVIDGEALSGLIDKHNVSVMQATPASWRLLIDEGWHAPKGFKMLCGGEALDLPLAEQLLEGRGQLWNMYGPTETTIWSACAEVTAETVRHGRIPLGDPVANTTLHVRDAAGHPAPPGVVGELLIGGTGLSPGYLNREELTGERFISETTVDGARLYRTGDLVRRDREGSISYIGRKDFQIKLRGFRIELAEIEATVSSDPSVSQAVVALVGEGNDASLVAYCVAPNAPPGLEQRLRSGAMNALPAYMVPSGFVFLDSFPLNTNGKVDRQKLPKPEKVRTFGASENNLPQTDTEMRVSQIWGEILGMAPPGRKTNFFALGGHSLLAMRVVARLPLSGSRAIPLRLLLEHPQLDNFAAALDRESVLSTSSAWQGNSLPRTEEAQLSYAQERQWTLARLDPGRAAYNIPAIIRLVGPVSIERLGRAFALLCARHKVLRSAYPDRGGRPYITLAPSIPEKIEVLALAEDQIELTLEDEISKPFDLARGPLIKLRMYRVTEEMHLLLVVLDHMVGDAQSLEILLSELLATYDALGSDADYEPSPLAFQYTDFAAWQRSQDTSKSIDYWVERLKDAPPLLEMPSDFQRPTRQSFRGDSVDFSLTRDAAQRLRSLASENDATPYMVFLALFATFLGRYSESDDVVIGTVVNQRMHTELESTAGMFLNTLALRLHSSARKSFGQILADCRRDWLEGCAHQDAPFEKVVEALSPERSWSHNPVFQALFTWKTREVSSGELSDGLTWQTQNISSTSSKMDLALSVLDRGTDFDVRLEYSTDLFQRETAENFARSFEALASSTRTAPNTPVCELSLLHPEQSMMISRWNETGCVSLRGPVTLHEKFSAQAAKHGVRLAVRDSHRDLTYEELEIRSEALARELRRRGVGAGDRVGIALPRDCDLVSGMLGVLKTGAAYVPLDLKYPHERIAYIAKDAGLTLTLGSIDSDIAFLDPKPFFEETAHEEDTNTSGAPLASASDTAYLIYTSGSTGQPKGVELTHANAHALIDWVQSSFAPDEMAGVLASTSICFDLSVFEIFATLAMGGTILMVQDLIGFPESRFKENVTLVNTVPTPMAELLRLETLPASVRTVCLAGEPLPPALARRLYDNGTVKRVWNLYGPSEDTTYSTAFLVPRDGRQVKIGNPITGTRAYVLDEGMLQLPPGLPGELFLSGAGVGKGYWNRPDQTDMKFVANQFDMDGSAPVMYRTGDRVRRTWDGSLEYLGREDRQVKIRGFRIEPGEVETALTEIQGVTAAVVDGWRDGTGPLRLTAWVETTLTSKDVRAALSAQLPNHCVPTLFVIVDTLPRLPNGKLDRKSLPPPDISGVDETPSGAFHPPEPGIETQIAAIWTTVLGRTSLGRFENFFTVGGDSILAIQVAARARDGGLALSPRDLFQHPTIAALAEAAAGREPEPQASAAKGPVTGPQTLTAAQARFFSRDLPKPDHWNQAIVLTPSEELDPEHLQQALDVLASNHDALRARFHKRDWGWEQIYADPSGAPPLLTVEGDVTEATAQMQSQFDLTSGPIWGVVLCTMPDGTKRLGVAVHHLVIDGVSWRILLDDLQSAYRSIRAGEKIYPLRRSDSPAVWTEQLLHSETVEAEQNYWNTILAKPVASLPVADPSRRPGASDTHTINTWLSADLTGKLLEEVPSSFPATAEDILVTALYITLRDWTGETSHLIELESHGRSEHETKIDLSFTVGWLTSLFPVHLTAKASALPAEALRDVKESLRSVPNLGVGYGVLRHLKGLLSAEAEPQVRFNYFGRAGALNAEESLFSPAEESPGPTIDSANPRDTALEINAIAAEDRLRVIWNFSVRDFETRTVEDASEAFARNVQILVDHCLAGEDSGFTPADFPDMEFDQEDLDDLLQSL